ALRSPEPVLPGHLSNEPDRLGGEFRSLDLPLGFPAPEKTESLAMPAQDGFWFHEKDGVPPVRHETRQQHRKPALVDGKSVALGRTSSDDELLAQERVLSDEVLARTGQIPHQSNHYRCRLRRGPRERVEATHHAARGRERKRNEAGKHRVALLNRVA